MLAKINILKKDELIKGSFILFSTILLYNFLNYIFQISMALMLGPADYGIVAVLMSIIYIFAIPNEAIQTMITKYASKFNAANDLSKIKDLLYRGVKKGLFFSSISFIIFAIIGISLSRFLKIKYSLILFTGLFIFIVFTIPVSRGILQGRKKFLSLGTNMVSESFIKVILGILLVLLGFGVYGAVGALVFSCFITLILSFFLLKDVIVSKRTKTEFGSIYKNNLPLLAAMVSVVLMYSLDIILARAFFNPDLAGKYAFISLIGKVIIFVSTSIGKAMFPISVEKFEKGKNTHDLFKKSILLVCLMTLGSLFLYLLFPNLIVKLISLGSEQYLNASNILFILGLGSSLIAISSIIILYKISINKMKYSSIFLFIFVILEVVFLSIFKTTLYEYSVAFLAASFLMFIYSLVLIKK